MANETLEHTEDETTTEASSRSCHSLVSEEETEDEDVETQEERKKASEPIGPDPGFFWDEKDDLLFNPVTDSRPIQVIKSMFDVDIPKPFQFTIHKRPIKKDKRKTPPPVQHPMSLYTTAVVTSAYVSTLQGMESQVTSRTATTSRSPMQGKKTANYNRKEKSSFRDSRVSWSIDSASSLGERTPSPRKRPERKSLPAQSLSYCRAIQEITPSSVPDFRRFLCRCPWLRLPSPPPCPQGADTSLLDAWTTVVSLRLEVERARMEEQENSHLREDMEVRSKFLYQGVQLCAYQRTRPRGLYWPL